MIVKQTTVRGISYAREVTDIFSNMKKIFVENFCIVPRFHINCNTTRLWRKCKIKA